MRSSCEKRRVKDGRLGLSDGLACVRVKITDDVSWRYISKKRLCEER